MTSTKAGRGLISTNNMQPVGLCAYNPASDQWVPVETAAQGLVALNVDQTQDFLIHHAIATVKKTYGHNVSVNTKAKDLAKFGRTANADSGVKTTIMGLAGSEVNETYVSTNLIDSVSSSSAADADKILVVEGHTIDGSGNLTFIVQNITLTGQSEATLSTPLARCNRMYVKDGTFAAPSSEIVGNIYAYDNTGVTLSSGVPNVAASVKCMIEAGRQQSDKCATSISSTDYWFISRATFNLTKGNSSTVSGDFDIEVRRLGGVFRQAGLEVDVRSGLPTLVTHFSPLIIVPSNADVRMVVTTNTNDGAAAGRLSGFLAEVI